MTAYKRKEIFFSAAEASGDRLCAGLVKTLKEKVDNIDFVGVGGERMRSAGCRIIENPLAHSAMTYKAFGKTGYYFRLIHKISRYLRDNTPDLVVVADSPSFNFHVAKAAKKNNIKTLFYVAPQLWAWASWRIHKLKRLCTGPMACVLPFEPKWFGDRGLKCEFVGSPMLEDITPADIRPKNYSGFEPANAKIAILPGSRPAELHSLWRPMQQIALRIKTQLPGVKFITVAADEKIMADLAASQIPGFECQYSADSAIATAGQCDFAVVASGSVTLQVAAAGCPMVIMYQTSPILWHLAGRWLVRTKFLSLPNILAACEIVPEFMPYFTSIEPIADKCLEILGSIDCLKDTSRTLAALVAPLAEKKASKNVAETIIKLLAEKTPDSSQR